MKTLKVFCLSLLAVFIFIEAPAQSKDEKIIEIKRLLDSKTFVFVAESATPMTGRTIRLNSSNYEVSFHKDSLNSFLPYFGVAYTAQPGMSQSPLSFSSSDFTYETEASKNGGQTISIRINKPNDPRQFTMFVSASGYTTLQVTSINRQPISFYGYITSLKMKGDITAL